MAKVNLESKTGRARLELRWKPYWLRLSGGISLGYRRSQGPGSWSVRLADGKRGNTIKRIAGADDAEPANGKSIMTFAQARDAALRLGRGEAEQATPVVTLADAIDAYKTDLAARGAGIDNVTRLLFNVPAAMLKRPVALLEPTELRRWRDAAAKRMTPASVNRLATILKAALNFAASGDARLNVRAWEIGLAGLPEATTARNVVVPESTIRRIVHAARDISSEFGLLVETLALTGARVSQLARCQVRDLAGERLMIPSSAKGQSKRATRTPVPIPASLTDRLRAAAAGRSAAEPLFLKPSGGPWRKSDQARPFARAIAAIGEDTDVVTSYALRHSHITAQLLTGLPVQLVARLHDTSASQIERHYAAAIASHADELVRGSMMEVDSVIGEVVTLRR
jgi:integrase